MKNICVFVCINIYVCVYIYKYYRQHRGEVVGLVFSPDGEFMYSADSQGSVALYNASEEDHNVIRVVCMYTHTSQCTNTTHVNSSTAYVKRRNVNFEQ